MTRDPAWRRYLRFTRPDPGADVDDELRFHMEELERGYRAQGMSADAARRAAHAQFGDVQGMRHALAHQTRHRQKRTERREWWLRFRHDMRIGMRKLARQPGFTATAVATLALGIGANAAVFSVVNAALLRPLPYPDAERIVRLDAIVSGNPFTVSPPDFVDWRSQSTSFTAMAAYNAYPRTLTGEGDPQPIQSAVVTGDFFDVMGIHPSRGRAFSAEELVYGQTDVAILSDALWRSALGAREDVIGRTIRLEGRTRVVVGVMPPGFEFPAGARIWTPWAFSDDDLVTQRGAHYLTVVARLRDGVAAPTAFAEIRTISHRLAAQYPESSEGNSAIGYSLRDDLVGPTAKRALIILLGAVALVTLIACANVANLLLARGETRQRELAVRSSLGARPRDLIGQALTESVLLAMLGGAAGLMVAWWLTRSLDALRPDVLQQLGAARLDPTVVAFTLGLSVVTGLLFGITPALQAVSAGRAHGTLRAEGRGNTTGREGWRMRGTLIAAELALAVMLLAGAGLLIRSFARLQSVEPGFSTRGLLTFRISLPEARYPDGVDAERFYDRFLERVRSVPGVTSAEAITGLPLDDYSYVISTSIIDGVAIESSLQPSAQIRIVTPGLFSTMGIRLVRGRDFTDLDRIGTTDVVVMSDSAARLLFGERDALGRSLAIGTGFGLGRGRAGGEVVGIVADIHDVALGTPPRPTIYFPHAQRPLTDMAVVVRARGGADPIALAAPIRAELRRLDALLPMVAVRTMDHVAQLSVAQPRFAMILLSAFAAVALALAAIGVFGVMSYLVGLRTREIGLRMALGAGGPTVVAETVRRALKPVVIGVLVGVAGALALSRTMTNLLYEVTPGDPATFVAVAIGLALVAVLAAWIPARRASRVDPVVALRAE